MGDGKGLWVGVGQVGFPSCQGFPLTQRNIPLAGCRECPSSVGALDLIEEACVKITSSRSRLFVGVFD